MVEQGIQSKSLVRQLDFVRDHVQSLSAAIRQNQESPRPRACPLADGKDGIATKKQKCNCKNSKCLKLYCECFAAGVYCNGCNCLNCSNNIENEGARCEAVELTLERNPNAFRPKIANNPHGMLDHSTDVGELIISRHNKGCHCKKSGCLKKYCECFQANILCSDNCKCVDCKNFEGSDERCSVCHGEHATNMTYAQQVACGATPSGAVGFSGFGSPPSRKRKSQDILPVRTPKGPPSQRLSQVPQAERFEDSVAVFDSVPLPSNSHVAQPGASKDTLRPLLADIIRPNDVKLLCMLLVFESREAAKRLSTTESTGTEMNVDGRENTRDDCLVSRIQTNDQFREESGHPKDLNDEPLNDARAEKSGYEHNGQDSASVLTDDRPMSPATLALMCDEEDSICMSPTSHSFPSSGSFSKVYIEQEKCILVEFRNCLQKLVNFGRVKEQNSAMMVEAKSEMLNPRPAIFNGITGS